VSERLLARRRRTLLQRYAGKLSFMHLLAALAYVPSYFLSVTE
jgi:membrane-bound lytic murein transglycosylase MltF